jgi:YHS domain-containing protein
MRHKADISRSQRTSRRLRFLGYHRPSAAKTDCSVNASIDGKTYCFGSEAAKTEFMKDPKGNMAKAQAYYSSKQKM